MSRKIKILHIIESLGRGGAEKRLVNDLNHMDSDRFENHVCVLFDNLALVKEIKPECATIHALNMQSPYQLQKLKKIYTIIKTHRIDLIHSQLFFADLYAAFFKKFMKRIPHVITIQATPYANKNSVLFSRKRMFLDKHFITPGADRFVAVSDYVRGDSIANLNLRPERCETIFNNVDLDQLQSVDQNALETLKQKWAIQDHDRVLLSIGRLVEPKGHIYLLRALKQIISKNKCVKLLLVGDGPERKHLEAAAQSLGISNHVTFLGEQQDVHLFLSLADIFVFPSLYGEGLPVALIEAALAKKLCIATNVKPMDEIISHGQNGFLYEPTDDEALAQLVLNALDAIQTYRESIDEKYQFLKERFSAKSNVKQLESLYEHVQKSHY